MLQQFQNTLKMTRPQDESSTKEPTIDQLEHFSVIFRIKKSCSKHLFFVKAVFKHGQ